VDDFSREAIEQLKNGAAPLKTQLNDWAIFDDLVYYKGKLAIPQMTPYDDNWLEQHTTYRDIMDIMEL